MIEKCKMKEEMLPCTVDKMIEKCKMKEEMLPYTVDTMIEKCEMKEEMLPCIKLNIVKLNYTAKQRWSLSSLSYTYLKQTKLK